MDPKAANVLVETLGSSLRYGGSALSNVPELVKKVIREDAWREFVTRNGEAVHHERFADFVTTAPLAGIGGTVELVKNICRDDTEALNLLDQALQNPASVHSAGNNVPGRPEGNSQAKALRRLRKDAPELHADVLAGRLSAHRAMVQAGFRPRTISVRTDDPERIAATLRRQLNPETISRLIELLDGR